MNRRLFLAGASATLVVPSIRALAAEDPWRKCQLVTRVAISTPTGTSRAWIPLPMAAEWQELVGEPSWTGNAKTMEVVAPGMFYAEWEAGESAPVVEVTSQLAIRDRSVDLAKKGTAPVQSRTSLERYLAPTRLLPTDGIVKTTATEITRKAKTDVAKARAIYDWIVDNTVRDPKVRGCGIGDIKTVLETRNLSGKCADLNGLFVGLARSVGVPARDLYGLRVFPSATYGSLGKVGDVTKSQHCRAEFHAERYGWVPADPADIRKLVLEENGGTPLTDPKLVAARAKFFGWAEGNWIAYNDLHDVVLPHAARQEPLPFFMYPQVESGGVARDSLDAPSVAYTLTSAELSG